MMVFSLMYAYCFAALIALGIAQQHIPMAILGLFLFAGTVYLAEAKSAK